MPLTSVNCWYIHLARLYILPEACLQTCYVDVMFLDGLYILHVYKCKNHSIECRDAPCEKSWKQGNPLSKTIKDTSTIMRNPLPELCREGLRMIMRVSLIVLLREFPCFHDFFRMVHPYIHIHSIE